MVYANDNWVQFPVRDIFDTAIMQMALSSAEKMYNEGQARMKEFKKDYGNFYSPNMYDMQWYDQNFSPEQVLQDLYRRGIDPVRSPEGRAEVARWINSRPIGELNARKQQAENIRTYLKNYAELDRLGKLDKNRETWELQQIPGFTGTSVRDWDFSKNGMFDRLSPSITNGIYANTNPWFAKYKPEVIMRANKDAAGNYVKDPNGMYDVIGITDERVKQALDTNLLDYISSGEGAWQYELSKRQLQAEGNKRPTQQQIVDRLKDNIISANDSVLFKTEQINQDYLEKQRQQFEMQKQEQQQRFTARENALNRQQSAQQHEDDMTVNLLIHGFDRNGNPIEPTEYDENSNSITSLASKKSGNTKGYVHYSQSVGITGLNDVLLNGVDTSRTKNMSEKDATRFYFNQAARTQDEKLKGLFAAAYNMSGSKADADKVWKIPSTKRWSAISNNNEKYNGFLSAFINSFSSDVATPESFAYYISGKTASKSYKSYYLLPNQNDKSRLCTSDQIIRNTRNFYAYENGDIGRKTQTTNDVIKDYKNKQLYYQPTGRVVTIIDKKNRRCQYIELNVTTNPQQIGKNENKKLYYKMYNTTNPSDLIGVPYNGFNDNSRSEIVETTLYGASANVNSGGIASISL